MAFKKPKTLSRNGLRGTRTHYSVFKEHPWANADSSQACARCQAQTLKPLVCFRVTSTLLDLGPSVKTPGLKSRESPWTGCLGRKIILRSHFPRIDRWPFEPLLL